VMQSKQSGTESRAAGQWKTGRVKWFNNSRQYGFIDVDDQSDDVFVHLSVVKASGYQTLKEGERVTFDVERTDKGLQANHVKKI